MDIKGKNIQKFLDKGEWVKITLMLRGREISQPQQFTNILEDFIKEFDCRIQHPLAINGRDITVTIIPPK